MDLVDVDSFGGIAADVDALLDDCFRDHPTYEAARAGDRFLIIGRKGSGKTAIYRRLLREASHDYFPVGHSFDDYPWHHHDLQAQVGVPEERRYVHSWKYLIYMTMSKVLLNFDQSVPFDEDSFEAVGDLESFVVDSYGTRDPDITQLFSPDKEIRIKGRLNFPIVGADIEKLKIRELPPHVQEVNHEVEKRVLIAMNPNHKYVVLFDQLDLGFSPSDPTYLNRLTGLILAARDVRRAARNSGRDLSVVVFLRDDLYGLLQFEDKNKLTEANLATVAWDIAGDADAPTLRGLMERRFGQTLHGGGSKPWNEVLDEGKEMPGRQTKYQHIVDRTFLRPRDMIKFSNEILSSYKNRGGEGPFTNEDVHSARDRYSDYLLRELDDEIAKHVPSYKEHLEVVGAVGRDHFTREQFAGAHGARPELSDVDASAALQELFDFSVIAYLKTGGHGGGSNWVWRYLDPRPHRARVPADAEQFRVHRGFKEALDLIQGSL